MIFIALLSNEFLFLSLAAMKGVLGAAYRKDLRLLRWIFARVLI